MSAMVGISLALGAGCASMGAQETTNEYFRDAAITSKIKARLLEDQALRGFQVKVDTYRGHVILSGFVNHADEIQEAVRIAKSVRGVVSVRNDLVVKAAAAPRPLPKNGVTPSEPPAASPAS
ncbi:MAG: BON domain-containing protein [Gammaproteobacteria bacterium]|nr:BON domain-containing protein [Gammaproteobacteria bacterium]